ncbi:hippocalcin-like protein 4 isoform X2 [Prorops nasuta]
MTDISDNKRFKDSQSLHLSRKLQQGIKSMKQSIRKYTGIFKTNFSFFDIIDSATHINFSYSIIAFSVIKQSMQDDDKQPGYILPEQLSSLMYRTGFSKDELRRLYRAFKQSCPRGAVTTGDLRPVYAKLFPLGDSTRYSQLIFNSFNKNSNGLVSFADFISVITVIVKGNIDEKLSWIFELYDLNGDGCITRREMLVTLSAIYEMVSDGQIVQRTINRHVDRIFDKMDTDKDGIISKEEFTNA